MEALNRDPAAAPKACRALLDLWLGVRVLGALAVIGVGAIHLHEYLGLYSAIPTIGMLFVLNFAGVGRW
jgi:hypothetical protein